MRAPLDDGDRRAPIGSRRRRCGMATRARRRKQQAAQAAAHSARRRQVSSGATLVDALKATATYERRRSRAPAALTTMRRKACAPRRPPQSAPHYDAQAGRSACNRRQTRLRDIGRSMVYGRRSRLQSLDCARRGAAACRSLAFVAARARARFEIFALASLSFQHKHVSESRRWGRRLRARGGELSLRAAYEYARYLRGFVCRRRCEQKFRRRRRRRRRWRRSRWSAVAARNDKNRCRDLTTRRRQKATAKATTKQQKIKSNKRQNKKRRHSDCR